MPYLAFQVFLTIHPTMKLRITAVSFLVLLFYINAGAQTSRLKVFINCQSGCDMNYIRTEINIVDFVLDRLAADVHVLITGQNTGRGGDKYQLIFVCQNRFKQMADTIYFDNAANNTDFEERDLLLKYMKICRTRFITKTNTSQTTTVQIITEKIKNET